MKPRNRKGFGASSFVCAAHKYRPRRRRGYRPAKPDIVHTQCGFRYPRIRREERKGIPDNGGKAEPCRIGNEIRPQGGRTKSTPGGVDDICAWRRRRYPAVGRTWWTTGWVSETRSTRFLRPHKPATRLRCFAATPRPALAARAPGVDSCHPSPPLRATPGQGVNEPRRTRVLRGFPFWI